MLCFGGFKLVNGQVQSYISSEFSMMVIVCVSVCVWGGGEGGGVAGPVADVYNTIPQNIINCKLNDCFLFYERWSPPPPPPITNLNIVAQPVGGTSPWSWLELYHCNMWNNNFRWGTQASQILTFPQWRDLGHNWDQSDFLGISEDSWFCSRTWCFKNSCLAPCQG